ncbi:MAG: SAM-dependent methyltransferase [Lachnospiraceae bacterium]|nr:SAM-dependent methyltransferase [Lachnospiraceae bacterium]
MKDDFEDYLIDAKLHIETTGRNDRFSDTHLYPYEATSYPVLDRLVESGYISGDDCLLDHGCGKGRVAIYLNHCLGCETIGVEVMNEFFEQARSNVESYTRSHHDGSKITLVNYASQTYDIPSKVTGIFFFNPFSIAVFKSVMGRVTESYYEKRRNIRLFLYYPQDEYIAYLSGLNEVMFLDEIDCTDLFPEKDPRNRIMIFEIQ